MSTETIKSNYLHREKLSIVSYDTCFYRKKHSDGRQNASSDCSITILGQDWS